MIIFTEIATSLKVVWYTSKSSSHFVRAVFILFYVRTVTQFHYAVFARISVNQNRNEDVYFLRQLIHNYI